MQLIIDQVNLAFSYSEKVSPKTAAHHVNNVVGTLCPNAYERTYQSCFRLPSSRDPNHRTWRPETLDALKPNGVCSKFLCVIVSFRNYSLFAQDCKKNTVADNRSTTYVIQIPLLNYCMCCVAILSLPFARVRRVRVSFYICVCAYFCLHNGYHVGQTICAVNYFILNLKDLEYPGKVKFDDFFLKKYIDCQPDRVSRLSPNWFIQNILTRVIFIAYYCSFTVVGY